MTHKKIFTDFFLLRFGKGQRSWLDAHNVTAVLALPFYLMITYTGLVTLLFTLMPWAASTAFGDMGAFYKAAYPRAAEVVATGHPEQMLPLDQLVARASRVWGGGRAGYIAISNPGDATATVEIYPSGASLGAEASPITLNAVTGDVILNVRSGGTARATQRVMVQLHMGNFAGLTLRWLYFLSGVGGTVMVATGLVLWTVKRRARLPDPTRPHFGFQLVERLNIGFIAGSPAGIAMYFLANRLLPVAMAQRADWEIHSLFLVWGTLFVWSLARPAKQAWVETLTAGAGLYALVPVVSALTTTRGLPASLMAEDWVFVGFDLTMVATAAMLGLAARKVVTHQVKVAPRRKRRVVVEAMA